MTRDDIIRLAREASSEHDYDFQNIFALERFAALVAAAEREACAKVCDEKDVMNEIEKNSEEYWNSLSKEEQLKAFCAVSRRIHQAEIVDQGTYRYALYNVFGFGPEAYAPAQLAGYLAIHNSIMGPDHDERLLKAFGVSTRDTRDA